VFVATAARDGALDGDTISVATSMPIRCSTDGLHPVNHEDNPMEPKGCLMKMPEEVTFKLTPVNMSCSVLGPSPALNVSDDVSSHAEPPTPWLAGGTLLDGFHMTQGWTGLMDAPSWPTDTMDYNGGSSSVLRPFLPSLRPKPPWLLLEHDTANSAWTSNAHPCWCTVCIPG
jgi:hypothetical protein